MSKRDMDRCIVCALLADVFVLDKPISLDIFLGSSNLLFLTYATCLGSLQMQQHKRLNETVILCFVS